MNNGFKEYANLIWSVADLLRGDYKQSEYGKIILPMTVLRRLDCVLELKKKAVLDHLSQTKGLSVEAVEAILKKKANLSFFNKSKYDFQKLAADPNDIALNLRNYIAGFSKNAREILEHFNFEDNIDRLDKSNLLYKVVKQFAEIDLHPEKIPNYQMGYIFEELIRKFADLSNETAGEHFTPREVIRLMVNILFQNDREILRKRGIVRTLYDPACGTGGMLSVAEEYLRELNPDAELRVFGQELNPESYAICNSDMLIKSQNTDHIKYGNSFTQDGLKGEKFDYMLSNPPFGVEWKKIEEEIRKEHDKQGFVGRFGAGLPRISDGSFLFLQHMVSKMRPENGGSRFGIVFNGSPLFSGGAGSGESEIRKWIIEKDMLEAIIALPDQLFYNTGISTYVWIVTNRKPKDRRGRIQLIHATAFFQKMGKSLGNKRNEIGNQQIEEISKIYGDFKEGEFCKIHPNNFFGYTEVTVERPLRLNFQASAERIARLYEEAAFKNLSKSNKNGQKGLEEIQGGEKLQKEIKSVLSSMGGKTLYKNRGRFVEAVEKIFEKQKIELATPLVKAILSALSDRDETADICVDSKKKSEADAELRDYENVPLQEDVDAYFKREVLPHVPDAWMDRNKDRVGYEINFTKEFYKYKPLRDLDQIRTDILSLEEETEGLMSEILKL